MSSMEAEPIETERVPATSTLAPAATQTTALPTTAAGVFIGITGVVDLEQVREHALVLQAANILHGAHLTLAYPGAEQARTTIDATCDLLSYPLPTAEGAVSPWAHTAAAQIALLALALEEQAQTIVLLHPDLGALSLDSFSKLADPVMARQADLVMASYTQGPFDSLITHSVLGPLTRALYGKPVRFPLAPDLAMSARLAARLRMRANSGGNSGSGAVLWPATVAAGIDASVLDVLLNIHHPAPSSEIDLATVLAQLVGSAFGEMEVHAPLWQRVRAGQRPTLHGASSQSTFVQSTAAPVASQASAIDTAPMIKSFLLGSRSLQDVWGLVLPPVTLLDLKRITLMPAEKFRLPDELWVRIIYDFALGYRLRTINRTHLLGALTPLYLGWVASYIGEASKDPSFHAAERAERLARAFEDGKPYLVRRWRWPDRFNP